MKPLRRIIHPQTRVIDEKRGTVEYIASNEAVDSYNEVIRASGWRFDNFEKNAPFVDSHNYGSIDCLLGRVIDFSIQRGNLVETVQWAIDVPENTLAQKGFAMTAAGYLKAVSVGFIPVRSVTPYGDPKDYQAACVDMKLPVDVRPACIYLEQQQIELSACCIGANPEAVAKAFRAGILNDHDMETYWPERERRSTRTFSFSPATPSQPMPQKTFLEKLAQLSPKTQSAFEDIEYTRRNPAESGPAARRAFGLLAQERRHSYRDPVARILADKDTAYFIDGCCRYFSGHNTLPGQKEMIEKMEKRSTLFGTSADASIFPTPVNDDVFDLILQSGAWKDLGVQIATGQQNQFAKWSHEPDAQFMTPTSGIGQTGAALDASLAGSSLTEKMNTVTTMLPVSEEWFQDVTVNIAALFIRMFGRGLSKRIDYACFQGNGADDVNNGKIVGIWNTPGIATVNANAGNTTVAGLQRQDFVNITGAVAPAALQRPCRWYINPALIPALLLLTEGANQRPLLKTPKQTGDEWMLVGFPVTWAAQAPAVVTPGSPIAAFGEPESYLVGIREELEIMQSSGQLFPQNTRMVRAISRARADMREITGFALLNLAAQ